MNGIPSNFVVPRKILLATDLRSHGDRALDRAAQLAQQWQAELHIVHALPWTADTSSPDIAESQRHRHATTHARAEKEIRRNLRDDIDGLTIHIVEGDPADAILDTAASHACDLIVLGAAEAPALGALGRVTEQLLRKSPKSLLIVKNRPHAPYARLLVGTDFTVESRDGLTTAAQWFPTTQITLMHVLDIPFTSMWLDASRGDELARMEMATMHSFLDDAPMAAEVRQQVIARVEHGHPEIVLCDYAIEEDVDLVVISAFRRGLAFHVLVGGTSRRIVPTSPRDVLMVRAQPR